MAVFMRPTFSNKLSPLLSTLSRIYYVLPRETSRSSILLQSKRTLLSDAYHSEETWINRERFVVDMDEMKINLDRAFYDLKEPVLSVELHKYIDNVYDKEELDVAEGYLYCYRHSPVAHHLRQSTGHSWLRLCIELGYPNQALKGLQNKRDYGLFPENYTYNLLLDTFLRADNVKGACDVAVVMMREETLEDCPLSRLLALYSCHQYLKIGDIPQEEKWDIGMTLADATRGVEGTLASSYHAIGYAMTGEWTKAIRVLESAAAQNEAVITQEAITHIENTIGDQSPDVQSSFEAAVKNLTDQGRVSSASLDSLVETEVSTRISDLESKDAADYGSVLERWHTEHMEALERHRLAVLDQEREEKERRLDELLRSTGGSEYYRKEVEEAQRRRAEAGAMEASQGLEHR